MFSKRFLRWSWKVIFFLSFSRILWPEDSNLESLSSKNRPKFPQNRNEKISRVMFPWKRPEPTWFTASEVLGSKSVTSGLIASNNKANYDKINDDELYRWWRDPTNSSVDRQIVDDNIPLALMLIVEWKSDDNRHIEIDNSLIAKWAFG